MEGVCACCDEKLLINELETYSEIPDLLLNRLKEFLKVRTSYPPLLIDQYDVSEWFPCLSNLMLSPRAINGCAISFCKSCLSSLI